MCILSEPKAMTGLLFFYLENNTRNTWQFLVSRGGLGDASFPGNPYLVHLVPSFTGVLCVFLHVTLVLKMQN